MTEVAGAAAITLGPVYSRASRLTRNRQHGVENTVVRNDTVKNCGACVNQHQARECISRKGVQPLSGRGPRYVRRRQRGHLNPEQIERSATKHSRGYPGERLRAHEPVEPPFA